ncbi:hypothetical protein NPIL_586051 [Nephila pilipes]|uniref:Uncharacterized protein n=1 Tax=Nephila pilipes TaxID=299642 RepID=A0A8X6TVN9_NEPPI|nr:hypothetical protein NPIL_586051 [Nephila pilipes]
MLKCVALHNSQFQGGNHSALTVSEGVLIFFRPNKHQNAEFFHLISPKHIFLKCVISQTNSLSPQTKTPRAPSLTSPVGRPSARCCDVPSSRVDLH